MKPSKAAFDLIKKFEFDGKAPPLKAYWDDDGKVWTIGWGHTRTAHKDMEITLSEANKLLEKDISVVTLAINRALKVGITQPMFDALVSFTFNVGVFAFRMSSLLRMLNKGNIEGAANQFPKWIYAGFKRLNGLARRREAERHLFLQDARITNREVL